MMMMTTMMMVTKMKEHSRLNMMPSFSLSLSPSRFGTCRPWTCRRANEERQRRSFAHGGQLTAVLTSRVAAIWCWQATAKGATGFDEEIIFTFSVTVVPSRAESVNRSTCTLSKLKPPLSTGVNYVESLRCAKIRDVTNGVTQEIERKIENDILIFANATKLAARNKYFL